jgi:hypothetical protein
MKYRPILFLFAILCLVMTAQRGQATTDDRIAFAEHLGQCAGVAELLRALDGPTNPIVSQFDSVIRQLLPHLSAAERNDVNASVSTLRQRMSGLPAALARDSRSSGRPIEEVRGMMIGMAAHEGSALGCHRLRVPQSLLR